MWVDEIGSYIAPMLNYNGQHIAIDDLVIVHNGVVQVKGCGSCNGNLFVLGDACEVLVFCMSYVVLCCFALLLNGLK